MSTELLFLLSLVAFTFSSRGLLGALTAEKAWAVGGYSRRAERVGRNYKIFAWGLLTLVLLGQTLRSFIETFIAL